MLQEQSHARPFLATTGLETFIAHRDICISLGDNKTALGKNHGSNFPFSEHLAGSLALFLGSNQLNTNRDQEVSHCSPHKDVLSCNKFYRADRSKHRTLTLGFGGLDGVGQLAPLSDSLLVLRGDADVVGP